MRIAARTAVAVLTAVLVAAGLAASGCASEGRMSGDSRNVGGVTMTFKAEPARVKAGQVVRLALGLLNNSGREADLRYPSGQHYDFWVTRGGREVWRWSSGRAFTMAIVPEKLEGQTGKQFTESWQTDRTGTFKAYGELKAEGFEGPLSGTVVVE
jgi:hypothetical protein